MRYSWTSAADNRVIYCRSKKKAEILQERVQLPNLCTNPTLILCGHVGTTTVPCPPMKWGTGSMRSDNHKWRMRPTHPVPKIHHEHFPRCKHCAPLKSVPFNGLYAHIHALVREGFQGWNSQGDEGDKVNEDHGVDDSVKTWQARKCEKHTEMMPILSALMNKQRQHDVRKLEPSLTFHEKQKVHIKLAGL